jgi:hypothetical protein
VGKYILHHCECRLVLDVRDGMEGQTGRSGGEGGDGQTERDGVARQKGEGKARRGRHEGWPDGGGDGQTGPT